MFTIRKIGVAFGVFASLALLVHGCGSGGGGGGGAPAGTAAQSTSAASRAFSSALEATMNGPGGGGAGEGGTGVTKSLKRKAVSHLSDQAQVRLALHDFKTSLAVRRQKALRATQDTGVQQCPGGGTQRVQINDNNTPDDDSDDSIVVSFASCSATVEDSSVFFNGSISATVTNEGFTLTLNRFTSRTTDSSGSFENVGNGTISFSGRDVACGDSSFLENATFTMNLSGRNKVDLGNDGTVESNESFALNKLIITLTETHGPEPDCTPGAITITMNGKASFTNHLNGMDNISATFTDFTMVVTPVTREIDGIQKEGDTLSLDGTIAVSSDCVNGTFTFSTPVGEEPFIPVDASCPVDGKTVVSRGGTSAAVIYTSTGGVQIDEGADGSVEQTFESCETAIACT